MRIKIWLVVILLSFLCPVYVFAETAASIDSQGMVTSPDGQWRLPLSTYWEVVNDGEAGGLYKLDKCKVTDSQVYLDLFSRHVQLDFPLDITVGKEYDIQAMSAVNRVEAPTFGDTFDMIVQHVSFYDYGMFSFIAPIEDTFYLEGLDPELSVESMVLRVDMLDSNGVAGYAAFTLKANKLGIDKVEYYFAGSGTEKSTGSATKTKRTEATSTKVVTTCIRCKGTGVQACRSCYGKGYIREKVTSYGQVTYKDRRCNACTNGRATCEACWGN